MSDTLAPYATIGEWLARCTEATEMVRRGRALCLEKDSTEHRAMCKKAEQHRDDVLSRIPRDG